MVFLFFAVPFGVCVQVYNAVGINQGITTLTTAVLVTTILSFIIGFVFKFRKTAK
jgi:hypothetical protein